jgi:hypothetical protein
MCTLVKTSVWFVRDKRSRRRMHSQEKSCDSAGKKIPIANISGNLALESFAIVRGVLP